MLFIICASSLDEVDLYLTPNSREPECGILQYWKNDSAQFPILAKIARDYLAVCRSSATSECKFSIAGRVITNTRNRLESHVAQAIVCLKSWSVLNHNEE